MKGLAFTALFFIAGVSCVSAQQPTMQNDWDIHKTLDAIALHADRLAPFLDQIHPQTWIAAGAPEAYVTESAHGRDAARRRR